MRTMRKLKHFLATLALRSDLAVGAMTVCAIVASSDARQGSPVPKTATLAPAAQTSVLANLVEHLTKQRWRKLSSLQQQERCAATTWRENVSSFALFS